MVESICRKHADTASLLTVTEMSRVFSKIFKNLDLS